MGLSRQEYWSGFPCPSPGNLPNSGIKHRSPALQVDSLLSELSRKSMNAGSGLKELTLGAALIDSQGSVRGHSSLSRHPSGIYYPR